MVVDVADTGFLVVDDPDEDASDLPVILDGITLCTTGLTSGNISSQSTNWVPPGTLAGSALLLALLLLPLVFLLVSSWLTMTDLMVVVVVGRRVVVVIGAAVVGRRRLNPVTVLLVVVTIASSGALAVCLSSFAADGVVRMGRIVVVLGCWSLTDPVVSRCLPLFNFNDVLKNDFGVVVGAEVVVVVVVVLGRMVAENEELAEAEAESLFDDVAANRRLASRDGIPNETFWMVPDLVVVDGEGVVDDALDVNETNGRFVPLPVTLDDDLPPSVETADDSPIDSIGLLLLSPLLLLEDALLLVKNLCDAL